MFTRKDIFLVFLFIFISYNYFSQTEFITTWETTTASESITIPTNGGGYNYNVNWGDGSTDDTGVTGNVTHTYTVAGTYTVTITGTFNRIYFNNSTDSDKIQSIEQWGTNQVWTSMNRAFEGCSNLVNNATDTPDLSSLTSLQRMFRDATSIGNSLTGNWSWDASNVENMASMFRGATNFNKDIDGWLPNPSSVTNLNNMFRDATSFNQDLNSWDTSLVANMSSMFRGATDFDGDIDSWDVEEVTTMSTMFRDATSFNQDLNSWTTTKLEVTSNMFYGATDFNGNISDWDVDLVTTMANMFRNATSFNQDIGDWITTSVSNMTSMFYGATVFNQDIGNWTTSSVTNFSVMFRGASSFNQDIGGWTTSAALNISQMFYDATAFNQDIGDWVLSSVTVMNNMFRGATAFNQDIGGWNTSSTTNMNNMFRGATSFDQDISGWNVSLVTNFGNMFRGMALSCANYNALLVGWDAQTLQPGEAFHGGNSTYCSAAAIAARANMIASDGWSFTDGGLLTTFTWSGSTDTEWNDSSNWQDGFDSDCTLDVSIPVVTNYPIIDSATEVTVDNLTINAGASLTVEGGLTVSGDLTTNDGLTVNSGGSIIVSGTSTGELTYIRNALSGEVYYNVSSPVVGETIEDYISNNPLDTGNGNVGLYYYDNDTMDGFGGTGYVFYQASSTGPIVSAKGYGTRFPIPTEIEFTGTMPTSDALISVATGSIDAANLVGNPFPSYLPLNTNAAATNNILTYNTLSLNEETAWFWDPSVFDYVAINNGSAAHFVPPAQGFFVDSSLGGGNLDFLESWQSHQSTETFYKNTDTTFRINLSLKNKNNLKKRTQIFYFENKTINFDNGYDSSSISDNTDSLILSSRLVGDHNSQNLAIQTLPIENLQDYIIPLNVKGNDAITFYTETINKPEGVSIFLEDRFLNTFNLLGVELNHTVNVGDSTNGIGRFYLHLQSDFLGTEDTILNNVNIYNSGYKEITISGTPIGKSTFFIYDILGKEISKESFNLSHKVLKKFSLTHLKTGFYIVNLKTEKGTLSKKIILK